MSKRNIITEIARQTGVQYKEIQFIVDSFLLEVKKQIMEGNDVRISKFGTFMVKELEEKDLYNVSVVGKLKPKKCRKLMFKGSTQWIKSLNDE